MEYKIKRIIHSGLRGTRGIDRTDGRYPLRIGRTVDLNLNDIKIGCPMILKYLKNADGSDYSNMVLKTSNVVGIYGVDELFACIETVNSIFEFERA